MTRHSSEWVPPSTISTPAVSSKSGSKFTIYITSKISILVVICAIKFMQKFCLVVAKCSLQSSIPVISGDKFYEIFSSGSFFYYIIICNYILTEWTGKYGIDYSYLLEIFREQVGWFVTAWNPRLYRSHFVE